ncbi:MAG TPA: hypothetical protein VJ508_01860, partial [Saprospiraceae bacterium]|nr:hypothetical protein [Saprospiraceae bacterium]
MRTLYFILLVLVTSALRSQDEAAIQKAFTSYQTAIGKKDGNEAAKYIDSHSIDYFKMVLDNVRNADSMTVESLEMTDKFNVLITRQLATKKEIHAFTPVTLAIFDFNHG